MGMVVHWVSSIGLRKIRSINSHQCQHGHEPAIIKCLAWSNDLVALASTAGRLQLIKFESSPPSAQDGPNASTAHPVVNIIPRVVRACNAVAFSPHEPHRLAVAADKGRGDAGLNVWDIETAAKALTLPGKDNPPSSRVQGRQASAYDHRADSRIVYQHGMGEAICAVAYLPQTHSTILVGVPGKYTRIVDMRLPNSATGTIQIPNKFNGGLCVDPHDDNKFACFGEDAAIRIWDRRHVAKGPMLCFTEADAGGAAGSRASSVTTIAYSPSRRGQMTAL
ncbi:hypothetical protein FRB90_000195 [Tulasnella sp. 427]|nr:hypothetical protein FRB90_000195 [Tulasnella sp. 427]